MRSWLMHSGATSTPGGVAPAAAPTTAAATGKPAASGRIQMPTYVPPAGPTPDVPGTDIIPPGFSTYPKSPTQTVANPPGDGSDVNVAGETSNALIPVDQNTLWQQLNKALNVNLKLNLAPFSDWAFGKFQALVAGGDLPDITMIPIGGVIPDLPSFLEAKTQDPTSFVSGDAVKDYPNLAALPTIHSKTVSRSATATPTATPTWVASCGRRCMRRPTTGASAATAPGPETGRPPSSTQASSWRTTCVWAAKGSTTWGSATSG